MKIINKTMDYEKVMALPVKPRKKPKKKQYVFPHAYENSLYRRD
jgi:hypothetical protein